MAARARSEGMKNISRLARDGGRLPPPQGTTLTKSTGFGPRRRRLGGGQAARRSGGCSHAREAWSWWSGVLLRAGGGACTPRADERAAHRGRDRSGGRAGRAGCAVALRPRPQGLPRHGPQHDARRSGTPSPAACCPTSTTRRSTTPTSRPCSTSSPTGSTFTDLQTRDMTYTVRALDRSGMACRVTSTAQQRHATGSSPTTSPTRGRDSVVMRTRLPGRHGPAGPEGVRPATTRRSTATAVADRPTAARTTRVVDHVHRAPVSLATPTPTTNAANRDYAVPAVRARCAPTGRSSRPAAGTPAPPATGWPSSTPTTA